MYLNANYIFIAGVLVFRGGGVVIQKMLNRKSDTELPLLCSALITYKRVVIVVVVVELFLGASCNC